MKIQPNPFANTPQTPARPNPQISPEISPKISQARIAFEAMLSAGAARTQITPIPAKTGQTAQETPEQAPFSRPGRVLDIRV
ncbi:MAG: hypothetical protein HC777_03415 [Hyphomonadaceae bacterium]|nr:hypothetical protein [Hyphomonadaceae bacterium]